MQILITVGSEGHATAQVLSAASPGEPPEHAIAAELDFIDAGAAPTGEEEFEAESLTAAAALETGALDGGAAPDELEPALEPTAAAVPAQAGAFEETGAAEEAGAAPTVADALPTGESLPRLRPVE